MIDFLRRDERQERYATERTKRFRSMLDRAGIRWGLGVYPNVETEYFAASSIGPVVVNVTTTKDETIVVIYNQNRDMTDEQLEEAARLGFSVGMPIYGRYWDEENKDQ